MLKAYEDDTIAAIATPPGEGAIAVIRVSGRSAITTVDAVFRGRAPLSKAATHTAHYGQLIDRNGQHLDDVVATVFRSPHSYTGEDSVEVSCHGGVYNTHRVLNAILSAGARQAQPGEFTKRAFLNGKLDLSQAEAVAELIAARSEAAHRASLNLLEGKFSAQLRQLRADLLDLSSLIELELDFSEEGLDLIQKSEILARISRVKDQLQKMADSYRLGKLYRDGVSVAIVGKPNAGKSSLFNSLLREDRAIVTEIPGTTRDTLEESISIDGVLFRLHDTAGLRETSDPVEQQGVLRAKSIVRQSQVVVLVVDASETIARDAALSFLDGLDIPESVVVAYNKIDLSGGPGYQAQEFRINGTEFAEVLTSAKTGEGLDRLRKCLIGAIHKLGSEAAEVQVTNSRHHQAILHAIDRLHAASQAAQEGKSGEFVAVDIHAAADALAEIIGEVSTDDMLNNIFQKFCIGK